MIGKINVSGGDLDINGIVAQYTAGANSISAGDFVSFVNDWAPGAKTQVATTAMYTFPNAYLLDSSRVLLLYNTSTSNPDEESYIYGVVCIINGTTITVGTATQITTRHTEEYNRSVTFLDSSNSKVLIVYSGRNGSNYSDPSYLYGRICTINSTTITLGTETKISTSDSRNLSRPDIILLNSSTILAVFYSYSSPSYVYGIACTISGITITAGAETQITSRGIYEWSTVKTVTNTGSSSYPFRVLITYVSSTSPRYLYGIICAINSTTITTGTERQISTAEVRKNLKLIHNGIYETAIYTTNGSPYYVYGTICYLDGTYITIKSTTQITTTTKDILDDIKWYINRGTSSLTAFITYCDYDGSGTGADHCYIYGVAFSIRYETMTVGTTTQISTMNSVDASSIVSISGLRLLVTYLASSVSSSPYRLYGRICTISGTTIALSTETQISTIAVSFGVRNFLLDGNNVLSIYSTSGSNLYYCRVCTINGGHITAGAERQIDAETTAGGIGTVALDGSKVFVTYTPAQDSSCPYGRVIAPTTEIKTTNSANDEILGVAKTNATAGETVNVYLPNV